MKKRSLKLMPVLVALVMLTAVITGCGSNNQNTAETSKAANQTAVEQQTKEELKEVTLRFYFPGEKKAATDEVWNAISEKYKDTLKAKFEINFVAWGDYADKLKLMAASGDNYDLNFDADWLTYSQMINSGAYLDLTDLLPKYAPKTFAKYQQLNTLPAVTVKGRVMAMPWTLTQNNRPYFGWRADLLEKAGLKVEKDSIKTIEDVDKLLHEIKGRVPAGTKLMAWDKGFEVPKLFTQAKYELCDIGFHDFVYDLNDSKCKIVPYEQTEAFKEAAKLAKEWFDDGIIAKNMLVEKVQAGDDLRNGKLFSDSATHEGANQKIAFVDSSWTFDASLMYPDKKYVVRSPLANLLCINKKAANPERTVMFVEMVGTDKELYDMVICGIKDKTYVLDGEKAAYPQGMDMNSSNYMDWHGQWGFWRTEFIRPSDTYGEGFWNKEAEFAAQPNNNIINQLNGLFLNSDSIKNEIAKRDQIKSELGDLLMYGAVKDVDKAVNEYIEKQKAAGLDKILVELQKQIDEFLSGK